jgi:hypothetical protein
MITCATGSTSLFAALGAKTGRVIGRRFRRHRAVESRKFLDAIDTAVPADPDVHVILDNYATHKTAVIKRWLAKRPRYHCTSCRRGRLGSTSSNAGSPCSRTSSCLAESIEAPGS